MTTPVVPPLVSKQSKAQLRSRLEELNQKIQGYTQSDILDDLIKDAVLFEHVSSELRDREVRKLTYLTLAVALASFLLAGVSLYDNYRTSLNAERRHAEVLRVEQEIQAGLRELRGVVADIHTLLPRLTQATAVPKSKRSTR